jgi:hypothetical protein
MAVPSTFADLSATPASNSGLISDSSSVNTIDDHLRSVYAFIASIYANSGNGWASPFLTTANPSYTGTLTGGTGVVNLGSGQFYKSAAGNIGVGTTAPTSNGSTFSNLDLRGATGGGGFFYSGDTAAKVRFGYGAAVGGGLIEMLVADPMIFKNSTAELIRLTAAGYVVLSNLPTSDPGVAGALWNDGGALKVS